MTMPGTPETSHRRLSALWDMTKGYDSYLKLGTLFPVECPTCPKEETHVAEASIHFTGRCEHHVHAIRGNARVGYLAESKLISILNAHSDRTGLGKHFNSEERLFHQILDELLSVTCGADRL